MIYLQLLAHTSLAAAIPVVENAPGSKFILGPEEVVTDFAVLNGENLDNLPPDFTVCSSLATPAFTSPLSPFQLLYQETKRPWVTVYFYPPLSNSRHHRLTFFVSSSSVIIIECDTCMGLSGRRHQHCLCKYRNPFGSSTICLASYMCCYNLHRESHLRFCRRC